ncbi:MAG: hypothetical protein R3A52_09275 [Polyangiales bacterium]
MRLARARHAAVGLCVAALGCAASQRPSSAPSSAAYRGYNRESAQPASQAEPGSVTSTTSVGGGWSGESSTPSREPTTRPVAPSPAQNVDSTGPAPPSPPSRQPNATPAEETARRVSAALQFIDAEQERMVTGLSECRTVCGAAESICTAAAEVCRLTGDSPSREARDARCARARVACADASRQRDGACPACPPRR